MLNHARGQARFGPRVPCSGCVVESCDIRAVTGAIINTTWIGFAGVMLAAGCGIPLLAALNARLGVEVGNVPAAVLVALLVALVCAVVVTAATGGIFNSEWSSAPARSYAGGVFLAFYLVSITWVAPKFGVSNAIFFVLLGQIVSAAVIDHFGLIGAAQIKMDVTRLLGIGLIVAGIFLARRRITP